MHATFSLLSLWPHALLVALLSVGPLGVQRRATMFMLAITLSPVATWIYWAFPTGVAPPRQSASPGQLLALMVASLIPLLATVWVGYTLRERGTNVLTQVSGAMLVGLSCVAVMPGFQLFFGCAFTGLCP